MIVHTSSVIVSFRLAALVFPKGLMMVCCTRSKFARSIRLLGPHARIQHDPGNVIQWLAGGSHVRLFFLE
jgi:hypothetical protein